MKKISKLLLLSLTLSLVLFTSCSNDDDDSTPITLNSNVTVKNTFQGGMTNGVETPIEAIFQAPEGSLAATANLSDAVEFPAYLLGLYDINIATNTITFKLVAKADDATYSGFFRTLEAGTTDRYYLAFDNAQNVKSYTSSDPAVKLRIDSNQLLVVEIGEGFNFNPGATFTITLK